MRKNAEKVIKAFLEGKRAQGDSKKTIHTDGRVLYSYAMPIAAHTANGVELIEYERAPSATTRSQVRAASFLIKDAIRVGNIGR